MRVGWIDDLGANESIGFRSNASAARLGASRWAKSDAVDHVVVEVDRQRERSAFELSSSTIQPVPSLRTERCLQVPNSDRRRVAIPRAIGSGTSCLGNTSL